ncbi:MAG: hypothetical protein K2J88_04690 [Oscillospiraceae bacterium]|nr:hypothetical protein [Oscillospiraceae bacterium]
MQNKLFISSLVLLCCLVFLSLSIFFSWRILKNNQKQNIITVCMPLPDTMTEQEAQATFEKLTENFEKQYSNYGINLLIYAGDSYEKAFATQSQDFPTVLIDIPENQLQNLDLADLAELIKKLDDNYITDMTEFNNFIPLSWSIPVVYTSDFSITDKILKKETLPENITQITNFYDFLENPEINLLSESANLALIEDYSRTSGAVRMIPVSENDNFKIIYHDYCYINANADKTSQKIGMLWIGYLLSEEAQKILFTEHFGNLPLHESAFEMTISQHQGLAIFSEIKGDIA